MNSLTACHKLSGLRSYASACIPWDDKIRSHSVFDFLEPCRMRQDTSYPQKVSVQLRKCKFSIILINKIRSQECVANTNLGFKELNAKVIYHF